MYAYNSGALICDRCHLWKSSTDGGKTLKTMMISAPNKGNTIDQNTDIAVSGDTRVRNMVDQQDGIQSQ